MHPYLEVEMMTEEKDVEGARTHESLQVVGMGPNWTLGK